MIRVSAEVEAAGVSSDNYFRDCVVCTQLDRDPSVFVSVFTGRQHSLLCRHVCPFILCPIYAGIVLKRRKLVSQNLHRRIA